MRNLVYYIKYQHIFFQGLKFRFWHAYLTIMKIVRTERIAKIVRYFATNGRLMHIIRTLMPSTYMQNSQL